MDVRARCAQVALAFLLLAGIVVARLAVLQLGEHEFWEKEAVRARTRAVSIPFRRGDLLDARGRPIATTRTTFDLAFELAAFRKESDAGRLLAAHHLITSERVAVARILAEPRPWIDELAALTVADVMQLEPGARRADLLVYVAWLVGMTRTQELVDRLRFQSEDALLCPQLAEDAPAIAERVRAEGAMLAAIERALELEPGELVLRIDGAIAAIDRRVLRLLARRDRAGRLFECERDLHKNVDLDPLTIARNVPHPVAYELAAGAETPAGLAIVEESRRVSPPQFEVCPLIVGRVGPPAREDLAELEALRDERYELALEPWPSLDESQRLAELEERLRTTVLLPDEELGRDGLEAAFEPVLRGRRGYRRTEADHAGGTRVELELVPPRPGGDVQLTLDAELQRAAESLLARHVHRDESGVARRFHGAFVLLELPEMKVRVLASSPSPSRAEVAQRYAELAGDERTRPLHPRAWKPWLPPPPGSSIKPIVAALALSAGVVSPASELACTKDQLFAPKDPKPVRCEGLHGATDVHTAIVKSCNHYFAQIARTVGSETMIEWLRSVGLGSRTGFTGARLRDGLAIESLSSEVSGTAEREPGIRNLMLLGMGQGRLDGTPLQMAAAIGALATRRYVPPTLIESVRGEAPLRPEPQALPIHDAAWRTVVAAMRDVTHDGGTASPSHGADLTVFDLATKTGTPEQWGRDSNADHSWLVGFFPSRAPKYAFAIFLERTGLHGGEAAAPLLLALLDEPAFTEIADAARLVAPVRTAFGGGP